MVKKIVCLSSLFVFLLISIAFTVEAAKVRLSTSVKTNPLYVLPMLAAEEKGIWKNLGLELEWFPFKSGGKQMVAMAAGATDVGWATTGSVIQGAARGVSIIIASDLGVVNTFGIWVRANSPIKTPQDLKGAKIGTSRFGGATHTLGRAVFKALGVEVKWIATGGSRVTFASLRAGKLDAAPFTRFTAIPLMLRGEIRLLLSVRDYMPKPWTDISIFPNREFAKRNPTEVKKTILGSLEAGQWVMKNRDWAVEKLKKEIGYSQKGTELAYPEIRYGSKPKINPKAIENVRNFLIKFGVVPKEKMPPLGKLYTTEFID